MILNGDDRDRRPGFHLVTTVTHGVETYLAGQPRRLNERFAVTVVSSPGEGLEHVQRQEGVHTVPVSMTRRITPARDAVALMRLYGVFRRARPAIVQTYSPKAGLLGMLAARLAGVPVRVHGIIGLPLMEAGGGRALVMRAAERLTYASATHLTCNSAGLRSWIHGRLSKRPIDVIGRGSINGVDTRALAPATMVEKSSARDAIGVLDDGCVFVFVGRLVRDKGIGELLEAFVAVHEVDPRSRLVLVGDYEDGSVLSTVRHLIETHPGVIRTGWRKEVRPLYAAADVLVLPSYREGMPNVVLEAGAMALPVVATDINGSNEVIADGENGLLVPPKDSRSLAAAMIRVLDADLRQAMSLRSRAVILADFDHERFCGQLSAFYGNLLGRG